MDQPEKPGVPLFGQDGVPANPNDPRLLDQDPFSTIIHYMPLGLTR
jgi:hypothetical protein